MQLRKVSRIASIIIVLVASLSSSNSRAVESIPDAEISRIVPPSKLTLDYQYPRQTPEELREQTPIRGFSNIDESVITALSKLANLRLLNLAHQQDQRDSSVHGKARLLPQPSDVQERNVSVPEGRTKTRKFHCHPIEDVYIPDIDRMVPAYICNLELRQFILSSERFRQDFRYHLDVTLDETTFNRLVLPDDTLTGNSIANVIPVTLTQRLGDVSYGIKRT